MAKNTLNLGLAEEEVLLRLEHSQAILDFAVLEDTLGRVLLTSSQTIDDGIAVKTGFFGIQTFRGKLEFADRYLQVRYGSAAALQQWASTRSACETAATGRNFLAHWSMVVFPDSNPGTRVVLIPPLQNPRRAAPGHAAGFVRQPMMDGPAPPDSIGVRRVAEIRATARYATVELYRFEAGMSRMPDPLENLSHWKAPTLAKLVSEYRRTVAVTEPRDD